MSNFLFFLAVLPSILLGRYIYKMDKFGKEPKKLVKNLFVLGILSAVSTMLGAPFLLEKFPILNNDNSTNYLELAVSVYIGIALIEEFFKWIYMKLYTWNNKEFNHIYDAIVYTVFSSLGFATFENILYVMNGGFMVAIIRAILSVPGHVFDAVFMGYHYGKSKQAQIDNKKGEQFKQMFLCILIPTLLHGTFDYLLFLNGYYIIIYLIYVAILYIISFKKVKQVSNVLENMKEYYCTVCGKKSKTNYCTNCGNKMQN